MCAISTLQERDIFGVSRSMGVHHLRRQRVPFARSSDSRNAPAGARWRMDDDDNGILPHIRGDQLARAGNTLPPAAADQDQYASVEIEVPGLGHVRIKYELMTSKRGRSRHWFWTATFAELAP